ncbi:MAG: MATE family efflux transporter [Actinomycetales bacterium]|nr:MATE family efflux transporter [Actinomycetales bacterium]
MAPPTPERAPLPPDRSTPAPSVDRREIIGLAVPAFLALVAEPLYLLADSAIVGHLGTVPLAGLGVAASVLLTASGLFIFLAYATTSQVARHLGAGQRAAAISVGLDGLWLSLVIGTLAGIALAVFADPLAALFGASDAAHAQAVTYLRVAAAGLPGMLATLAATGTLRGLLDTRTPLVASVVGLSANVALNLLFVHGLHWGIAGSAWGTMIAQTAIALALTAVVLRGARTHAVALRPHPGRILAAARDGIPLVVRTIALRAVLLLSVWAAAHLGDAPLAAHQVVATIWSTLAFAVDALAIAAQAVVGRNLGAGDITAARAATRTMLRWGIASGVLLGGAVVALQGVLLPVLTPDPAVQGYAGRALLVVAAGQLVAGYVFVADGVLMGAGDFRYLAWAMLASLTAYLPMAAFVRALGVWGEPGHVLVVLWIAFVAFMAVRMATLWWRLRGDAWAITGTTTR